MYLLNIQHAKSSNTKAKLNNQQCNFESVLQTFYFNRGVNHADGEVASHLLEMFWSAFIAVIKWLGNEVNLSVCVSDQWMSAFS